ncbi:MAG: hypothetical protein R3C18_11555 [Planctomycetaceae bacterium]
MRIQITCPNCRDEFPIHSSFVGTRRKCPHCEHKFVLNREMAEADGTDLDHLRGEMIACPGCWKSFIPTTETLSGTFLCRFCDDEIDLDEGRRTFAILRKLERQFQKGLLHGKATDELADKLLGRFPPDQAADLREKLESLAHDLPMLRQNVLVNGGQETSFVRPQPYCDFCGERRQELAVEITWRHTVVTEEYGMESMFAGLFFGFGGARTAAQTTDHRDRTGLYFLCKPCGTPYVSWWRRFLGFTASRDGFQLLKARRCKLTDEQDETVRKYI